MQDWRRADDPRRDPEPRSLGYHCGRILGINCVTAFESARRTESIDRSGAEASFYEVKNKNSVPELLWGADIT